MGFKIKWQYMKIVHDANVGIWILRGTALHASVQVVQMCNGFLFDLFLATANSCLPNPFLLPVTQNATRKPNWRKYPPLKDLISCCLFKIDTKDTGLIFSVSLIFSCSALFGTTPQLHRFVTYFESRNWAVHDWTILVISLIVQTCWVLCVPEIDACRD